MDYIQNQDKPWESTFESLACSLFEGSFAMLITTRLLSPTFSFFGSRSSISSVTSANISSLLLCRLAHTRRCSAFWSLLLQFYGLFVHQTTQNSRRSSDESFGCYGLDATTAIFFLLFLFSLSKTFSPLLLGFLARSSFGNPLTVDSYDQESSCIFGLRALWSTFFVESFEVSVVENRLIFMKNVPNIPTSGDVTNRG